MEFLALYLLFGVVISEFFHFGTSKKREALPYLMVVLLWAFMLVIAAVKGSAQILRRRSPEDNALRGLQHQPFKETAFGELPEHELVDVNPNLYLICVDGDIVGVAYRKTHDGAWRAADKVRVTWKWPSRETAVHELLTTQMAEAVS